VDSPTGGTARGALGGMAARSIVVLAICTGGVSTPASARDLGGAGAPAPLVFEEESFQRGLNYLIGTPFAQFGAGVALIDLNNDGHLDAVVLGATNGLVGVYQNTGTGNFINRSFSTGIAPINASGVSAADYNGDGLLDLFVGGWLTGNRMLRNNGNFTFTDVTAAAGLTLVAPTISSTWSDYNGDGWLDLYVSTRTATNNNHERNRFYRNNGDGTFTDVAAALGVDCEADPSLLAAFFDFDNDGLDDLYVGTDKGSGNFYKNRLFRNTGGAFVEITDQANAAAYIDCMGFAIGDLDYDGFFDVYMTNLPIGNKLYMNDGAGAFVDQTAAAGMGAFAQSWGTVFADFDDDTRLDTYVCVANGPNQLFQGVPAWPMTNVAAEANAALTGTSYALAVGDVDGDHRLDMLVGETSGRVKLLVNRTESESSSVRFRVVGQGPNTFAVGARLDIEAGGIWQARQIYAGSNYKATNEFTVHVGLGASTQADRVIVRWPGTGDTRELTNVPANHQWTLYPPERLGDANGDGRYRRDDLFALLQAITGPGVAIQPGQERFDMDGDFDIDFSDLTLLIGRLPDGVAVPKLP